jgi:nucleoside-diphosphate-sugar epimerase
MPLNFAILGASGNVGRLVVNRLLSQTDDVVGKVKVINRRTIDDDTFPGEPRLVPHVVNMSSGEDLATSCEPILRGVDVVVSTMGIGSGKGTPEEFQKVEATLPSAFASAAARAGVRRAVLLTSIGSNIESTSSWLTFFVAVNASKMPISENDVRVFDGHDLFALLPGSRTQAIFARRTLDEGK